MDGVQATLAVDTVSSAISATTTNGRIDMISLTKLGVVVVTEGTAALPPIAPACPSSSIPLALVTRAGSRTDIVNDDISIYNATTREYTSASTPILGLITSANNVFDAINELKTSTNTIGDVTTLTTTNKSSAVAAINEVNKINATRVVTASGATVTLGTSDTTVIVTGTSSQVIALPAFSATYYGKKFTIINIMAASYNVVVTPNGSDNIDGGDVMNNTIILTGGSFDTISIMGYPAAAVNAEWTSISERVQAMAGSPAVARNVAYDSLSSNSVVTFRAGTQLTLWTGSRWVTRTLLNDSAVTDNTTGTKYPYAQYSSANDNSAANAITFTLSATAPVWSQPDGFWISGTDRTKRWLGTMLTKTSTNFNVSKVVPNGDGRILQEFTARNNYGIVLYAAAATANTAYAMSTLLSSELPTVGVSNMIAVNIQTTFGASIANTQFYIIKSLNINGEKLSGLRTGAGTGASASIAQVMPGISAGVPAIYFWQNNNSSNNTEINLYSAILAL